MTEVELLFLRKRGPGLFGKSRTKHESQREKTYGQAFFATKFDWKTNFRKSSVLVLEITNISIIQDLEKPQETVAVLG